MKANFKSGSVRGVRRNPHPYRDPPEVCTYIIRRSQT